MPLTSAESSHDTRRVFHGLCLARQQEQIQAPSCSDGSKDYAVVRVNIAVESHIHPS